MYVVVVVAYYGDGAVRVDVCGAVIGCSVGMHVYAYVVVVLIPVIMSCALLVVMVLLLLLFVVGCVCVGVDGVCRCCMY